MLENTIFGGSLIWGETKEVTTSFDAGEKYLLIDGKRFIVSSITVKQVDGRTIFQELKLRELIAPLDYRDITPQVALIKQP